MIAATTRLRRLDVLFAEKVLGHKTHDAPWLNGLTDERTTERFISLGQMVPHYTRSLDAAWEGAEKIRPGFTFRLAANMGVDGRASHPAEALVLACLRAVGVKEEELV